MILVCQVNYYNIGSTLHKYECWEIDICRDICDICFYKKGALKLSKMLQLAWNFFWLDKIKIYCHLSFFNFSVRQVWNWYLLRYLPYLYLQGGCCKIVQNNQICVKFIKVSRCSCCQRQIERSNTYMNGIGFIWLCIWQCFGIMWHVGPRLWISEIIGLKYITKNSQKRDHSIAIYSIFWIGMVYFGYHLVKAHVQTVQNMYGKGG